MPYINKDKRNEYRRKLYAKKRIPSYTVSTPSGIPTPKETILIQSDKGSILSELRDKIKSIETGFIAKPIEEDVFDDRVIEPVYE